MKIEAGKRYVTRGGWVTPALVRSTSEDFPWRDQDDWFRWGRDGTEYNGKGSPLCLIAEYVEPTPTDPSRIEIAARVLAALSTPVCEPGLYQGAAYSPADAVREALIRADALIAAERETRE